MSAADVHAAGLLERDAALGTIDDLLRAVRSSVGGLLLVNGDAGMGKSRLLDAAATRAEAAGIAVRASTGDYLERSFAWRAAAELFGEATEAPSEAGEEGALELMRRMAARVAALAEIKPQLLILDDAHWLDAPTLRLVHFLAGRLDGLAAGILLARRPRETDAPQSQVLQAIAAHPSVQEISLGALGPASIQQLVRMELGEGTSGEFCRRCEELTGGNPFYLRELLRSVPRSGDPPTPDLLDGVAPPTLTRSVLIRIARIGAHAAALANALAVLGDDAQPHHVASLAGLDVDQVLALADQLQSAGLVLIEPRLRFAHPLVRAAVESEMPAGARAGAHARAASLLLGEGALPELIAAHLLYAPAGVVPEALATLRVAATRAVARGAPASAVVYLERAVDEPQAAKQRASLLTELAEAAVAAGSPSATEHIERALLDAPDGQTRARIRLAMGWTLHAAGRFADAAIAFEAGLADAPATDQSLIIELRSGSMTAGMLDAGRAAETHRQLQALDDLPTPRDAAERHYQSQLLVLGLFSGTTPADTLASYAERQLTALDPGADRIYDWTRWNLVGTLSWCDRFDSALASLDPLMNGDATLRVAMASYARSWPSLWTGRIAQAAEDARRAVDLWTAGAETYLPAAAFWLVSALCELGHTDRAVAALTEIDAERWQGTAFFCFVLAAQGRVAGATGDLQSALDGWRACGAYFTEAMHARNPTLLPWRSEAAILAARLGDAALAREIAEEDLAMAEVFGAPRALGAALRASGIAKGGEEGIAALECSVSVLGDSGAVLEHTHAQLDLGAALRRAGSRARAREPLRAALAVAQRCGAQVLAARAGEELLATGARDVGVRGVGGLTPSEQRIAELAARGLTNREIAAQLFVTVKAVEFHLSRVFAKLDVSGRRELQSTLTRQHSQQGSGRQHDG